MSDDKSVREGPLSFDSDAESADPGVPAFLARPKGMPVYHGLSALKDVPVDGFILGKITDWEQEHCDEDDALCYRSRW